MEFILYIPVFIFNFIKTILGVGDEANQFIALITFIVCMKALQITYRLLWKISGPTLLVIFGLLIIAGVRQ
jgi:hypothetical protein